MSVNLLKKVCLVTFLGFALQACGGRAAHPVLQYNALDNAFSCEHLKAEFNLNKLKFSALDDEEEQRNRDNTTQLLLGSPLLLDFTSTLDQEREALLIRNSQIKKLGITKNCEPFGANIAQLPGARSLGQQPRLPTNNRMLASQAPVIAPHGP